MKRENLPPLCSGGRRKLRAVRKYSKKNKATQLIIWLLVIYLHRLAKLSKFCEKAKEGKIYILDMSANKDHSNTTTTKGNGGLVTFMNTIGLKNAGKKNTGSKAASAQPIGKLGPFSPDAKIREKRNGENNLINEIESPSGKKEDCFFPQLELLCVDSGKKTKNGGSNERNGQHAGDGKAKMVAASAANECAANEVMESQQEVTTEMESTQLDSKGLARMEKTQICEAQAGSGSDKDNDGDWEHNQGGIGLQHFESESPLERKGSSANPVGWRSDDDQEETLVIESIAKNGETSEVFKTAVVALQTLAGQLEESEMGPIRSFFNGTAKRLFKEVNPEAMMVKSQARKARKKEKAKEAAALSKKDALDADDEKGEMRTEEASTAVDNEQQNKKPAVNSVDQQQAPPTVERRERRVSGDVRGARIGVLARANAGKKLQTDSTDTMTLSEGSEEEDIEEMESAEESCAPATAAVARRGQRG
jgi:hypothetical protein